LHRLSSLVDIDTILAANPVSVCGMYLLQDSRQQINVCVGSSFFDLSATTS